MKILYYNWVPGDYPKIVGGGVQVYQNNVLDGLMKNNTDDEIYYLSSGFKYNPLSKKTYFRKQKGVKNNKVKYYEIINSPIIAPMYLAASNIKRYTDDEQIVKTFADFVDYCGGFDVIHINNFEGITPACLKIKEKYPNTKIVFSVHNYIPLCPRAQYFQEQNSCVCKDFKHGKECVKCFMHEAVAATQQNIAINNYFKDTWVPKFIRNFITKKFKKNTDKYFPGSIISNADDFNKFRKTNIEYINKYVDVILAVSQRVADICVNNGMDSNKVKCSYIGTKFADIATYKRRNSGKREDFTICYLGYARNDKGYFFMLDALSELPDKYKKNIKVVVAARGAPMLEKLSDFKSVKVYDGYSHENINEILSDVDLGLVPVIWEDNLPQVAIEMSALGIPVLASSLGGASELTNSELFKFNGGNKKSFQTKLLKLVENPDLLDDYYKYSNKLQTIDGHIQELKKMYSMDK